MDYSMFVRVPFDGREVLVTRWNVLGFGVVDERKQAGVHRGHVRSWIAYTNRERSLNLGYYKGSPPDERSISIVMEGYASFLHRHRARPKELKVPPADWKEMPSRDEWDEFSDYEDEVAGREQSDEHLDWEASNYKADMYDEPDGDRDPARPREAWVNYSGPPKSPGEE